MSETDTTKRPKRRHGKGGVFRPWYIDRITRERRESPHYHIRYTDPATGQQRREATKCEDEESAKENLYRRLEAIRRGESTGPDVDKTRVADLLSMILTDYSVNNRRSIRRLRFLLPHLESYFGKDTRASRVDEARIGQYVAHRQSEGAANGTVNRELTALKRAFHLAADSRRVVRVPKVAMLKEAAPRSGFVERAQHDAIVAALPAHLRPVLQAAFVTGWRIASEILTRQWRHVDLKAGWLRLEPGESKSGKGRMFPLVPELRAVLEVQRERTDAVERASGRIVPWVFHRNGVPIRESGAFRRTWQQACKAAGVPRLIPHDYRRSAVRSLERASVPRSSAMAMVGHETESIYKRYAIVDEAMLNEGAAKLAAYHEATKGAAQKVVSIRRAKKAR
jgi:integrase